MQIETIMMIIFILALVISIWKIYVFLPNKALADDDTNEESVAELEELMLMCINRPDISKEELFMAITKHKNFDAEHYWRFNQNRLNNLLNNYIARNKHIDGIKEIYELNIS
jgi:hypothetical protein